jgi:hypothetical protein
MVINKYADAVGQVPFALRRLWGEPAQLIECK